MNEPFENKASCLPDVSSWGLAPEELRVLEQQEDEPVFVMPMWAAEAEPEAWVPIEAPPALRIKPGVRAVSS